MIHLDDTEGATFCGIRTSSLPRGSYTCNPDHFTCEACLEELMKPIAEPEET